MATFSFPPGMNCVFGKHVDPEDVCLFHLDVTVLGFQNVEDHSKHCWKSLVNDGFQNEMSIFV